MALTVYGSPRSRTMRVLWMLTELNLDFQHVSLEHDDPRLKEEAFTRLNPAGAIPTIVDDGLAVAESLAINLYLAKKYGNRAPEQLYATSQAEEAQIWRWSLWAQGHLEPWVQKDALLAELISAIGPHADGMIAQSLQLLDRVLADSRWLATDRFTVCDLNVAAVLSPSRAEGLDLAPWKHVTRWLQACYQRPAALAARERFAR